MERGFIKLWRCVQDNHFWNEEKFSRGQAWLDLLMLANHKISYVRKRGIQIVVNRGQVGWSERQLAERWQWSRGKVSRFLEELEKEKQIEQQNGPQNINITSLITIINYDKYQTSEPQNGPQTGHKRATNSTMNKNEKNEKKEKPFTDSDRFQKTFEWFWKAYALEEGRGRSGNKKKTLALMGKSIKDEDDALKFCFAVKEYFQQVDADNEKRSPDRQRELQLPEVFANNWQGYIPENAEARLAHYKEAQNAKEAV